MLFVLLLFFCGPSKEWPEMACNGAGSIFFRLIQTLLTFWATWIRIRILMNLCFYLLGFQTSKKNKIQVPIFSKSCLGLGWAWAGPGLGPSDVGCTAMTEQVKQHKVKGECFPSRSSLSLGTMDRLIIPIAPPWVDSSKGPPRKIGKIFGFSGPRKKWPRMAPNGAGRFFFQLKKILPTFWAERILILRIFNFWIFWKP